MSLEAQITDLTITLKRLCSVLEAAQEGDKPKIQNVDLSGQLEETPEADDKDVVETEEAVEEKPAAKKTSKKVSKKTTKKVEKVEAAEEADDEDDSGDAEETEITAKMISPLLHKLTTHYADENHDGDKKLGKKDVLAFMEDSTGVRRLDELTAAQLPAFHAALTEELA